jgi:hypothetical protein
MINSRRMRWTGHVACTVKKRTAYRVLLKRPEREHYEDLDVGGRIL